MQDITTIPACKDIMLGIGLLVTYALATTGSCRQQVLSISGSLEFSPDWKILGPFRLGTRGDHLQQHRTVYHG
jgi:hypothetical protein